MKIFTRILSVVICICMLSFILSGCSSASSSSEQANKTNINVAAIKGPSSVGMVHLMDKNNSNATKNQYQFTVANSPDEIVGKLTSHEVDIAAVPTNLAASIYNKTNQDVQMLAVSTLGVLYIMENGNTIQSVADLKGQTIYTTGQGANPEYVLEYVLRQNGLDPEKDVTISYVSNNDELATLLASGQASVAMVPEPTATIVNSENPNIRYALDMTEEWNNASNHSSSLMMGCVIGNREFIAENEQAIQTFLNEYKDSIDTALSQIDATANLCATYDIISDETIAKKAIPRCNITYIDGAYMKEQIEGYLSVLYQANPKSIGGAMPDDNFYYQAE